MQKNNKIKLSMDKECLDSLMNRKNNILRNIVLDIDDIDGEILSDKFYQKDKVSKVKKDVLRYIDSMIIGKQEKQIM